MKDKKEQKKEAPQAPPAAAQPTPAQQEMTATIKEIEGALFAVKFYPVAVNEQSKKDALTKIEHIYAKGNDTVRQLLLYMLHEILATSSDLKLMHTLEYFKTKNQGQDPAQQRISVYRAMFNYNTSLEGLIEIIKLLGRLRGDDTAKLLTYHFSHLSSVENESSHILRAAVLESLGKSESQYALRSLLEYARYTDSERTFNRVVSALAEWEGKVDKLDITASEKSDIRKRLKEIITSDFGGSHYG